MTPPVVLLDACTLVPIRLASCLLALADAGLLVPLWSGEILDEVERNLPKVKGMTVEKAQRRVETMRVAFGDEASVEGYQHVISKLRCDPKDRHVLASAIIGGADVLLTFNLKDFPVESAYPHGVIVQHPDEFLAGLLGERPMEVLAALEADASRYRRPPTTMSRYLAALTSTVPMFANLANDLMGSATVSGPPVAAVVTVKDSDAAKAYGAAGDLTDPAQVALLWWSALLDGHAAVRALSANESDWGDYTAAREHLAGRSLASRVIRLVDAPDDVAVMRFVPEVPASVQVYEGFVTTVTFLTLVRVADGTWRVWGVGPAIRAARDILA